MRRTGREARFVWPTCSLRDGAASGGSLPRLITAPPSQSGKLPVGLAREGEKALAAPIERIERFRSHRLIPVLTHDVDTISAPLVISLTITLGCVGLLSWPMFLLMLAAIAVGVMTRYEAQLVGMQGFIAGRDAQDELQSQYDAVAGNAQKLRIHRPRRHRTFTHGIQTTAEFICKTQIRAINTFVTAKTFDSMLFCGHRHRAVDAWRWAWPGQSGDQLLPPGAARLR